LNIIFCLLIGLITNGISTLSNIKMPPIRGQSPCRLHPSRLVLRPSLRLQGAPHLRLSIPILLGETERNAQCQTHGDT